MTNNTLPWTEATLKWVGTDPQHETKDETDLLITLLCLLNNKKGKRVKNDAAH